MSIPTTSTVTIPPADWMEFLHTFSHQHWHWQAQVTTHDFETGEVVSSPETRLDSIELDLEDVKNPRINVVVELDNKVVKHILFCPSRLVFHPSPTGSGESLQIKSVNTSTTVELKPNR